MKKISFFLRRRLKRAKPVDADHAEELRIAFKERYHHFKLLLNANKKALEIMATIEQALQGKKPFGMSFVKTNCTAITVNLLRLLKNLEKLSDGKYNQLYSKFDEICKVVSLLIEQKPESKDERLTIPLTAIDRSMADLVGGKMANLGEILNRVHLTVPAGFAITAQAYRRFMEFNDLQTEIDRRFIATDITDLQELAALCAQIRNLIVDARIPQALEDELQKAAGHLKQQTGATVTLAVRSSAIGEDSAANSFAGQYQSALHVPLDKLMMTYREIVASKFSLTAFSYRLNRGIRDEDIAMSVGCLAMISARSGGVMYSRNPIDTADSSIFINSTWGLPQAVVDGRDGDLLVVGRVPELRIIRKKITEKRSSASCPSKAPGQIPDPSGPIPVPCSISDEQALDLAQLAVAIEKHYGAAQDIEWVIDPKGVIYILQCRPLQQMDTKTIDYTESLRFESRDNVIASGGILICRGVACGEVFIVHGSEDMAHFPQGAVLVARQALPLWASLLSRAAAVVTEQGTFASHLANVAREFNVPAVFGIKNLTTTLKNGDLVTVAAADLTIFRGRIAMPEPARLPTKSPMEGSAVYQTLFKASKHILPLSLLDPYAPDFKAENCKTFHDITRFAHEKSVQEMFDFGKGHNFSERSSKQLFYKVPMQWWVLNLDDGVKEEVEGKYIRLENICCIPMIALWQGIIAVPWKGPPPIDGKGLASVMFQSTANRALEPSMRSVYTERNYFMISKNFCSFTSRLGYHFSIVEALVSERTTENYISFRFKGGAADDQRRVRRVQFIADILTDHSFRVELVEDNLASRIEGYEMDFMLERLRILGYLVMHTRQLDMIMSNKSAIAYYRCKIDKDIQTHLLNKGQ